MENKIAKSHQRGERERGGRTWPVRLRRNATIPRPWGFMLLICRSSRRLAVHPSQPCFFSLSLSPKPSSVRPSDGIPRVYATLLGSETRAIISHGPPSLHATMDDCTTASCCAARLMRWPLVRDLRPPAAAWRRSFFARFCLGSEPYYSRRPVGSACLPPSEPP